MCDCPPTGLIIDAFGELRDQLEQVKEDMEVRTINYTNTMLFGIYPTFLKNSNLCTDSINCLSKCICLLYIFYLFKILVSNFQSNYTWVTVSLIRKKYLYIFIRLHLWYKQMVTASIILNRTWFKKNPKLYYPYWCFF